MSGARLRHIERKMRDLDPGSRLAHIRFESMTANPDGFVDFLQWVAGEALTVLQVNALAEDGSVWRPGKKLEPKEHRQVGSRMWYRLSDSDELLGGIDAIHWPDEGGFESRC